MSDERVGIRSGRSWKAPGLGERLLAGRYRVDQLIGRGGMAEVHLGFDTRLGRTVAIKLLRSSLANDPTFRIRFRQEAQSAARMTHPTIVRVFDAGEETVLESGGGEAQLPFIVMEFVDGLLLKDMIKAGPMTAAEATHIVAGILTALEYSHRAGVVHRDIKPGNIMVTRSGQVKVMDFGIARAISDSSATVAQTSAILGTAQYFSPEQARGETVDARSDLYSTGIVLFEMLTGQPPFRGESPVAVAYQHVSEAAPAPSSIVPGVLPAMDMVTLMALTKDKTARYQTAAEFRADAEAALAGRTTVAESAPIERGDLFGGSAPTAEVTVRRLALDDPPVTTASRPPMAWIWAGIVTVAVVVIAVAVWVAGLATGGFGADQRTVPSGLAGASLTSAEAALRAQDLVPVAHRASSLTVEKGLVIRTEPGPNTTVTESSSVQVWVSTGVPMTTVPTLTGLSKDAALQQLQDAGLDYGYTTTEHSVDVPANTVTGSDPKAGTSLEQGTSVDITVSDGQVELPNLVGTGLSDAQDQLEQLGLVAAAKSTGGCGAESKNVVIGQTQAAGPVDQGSKVNLTYCDGT